MNDIAMLHLEIGIVKELETQGIITKEEMKLAIIEIKKDFGMEVDE